MALGRLGKYERVDVLGHGVSGIVYLAWDTLLKKQVALKEINLEAADVERFMEEARVMDRLDHPGIVRVHGVDRIDGHVVIDMEFVKGENLQQLLRREGRLPVDRALDIAIQVLDALDYAHRMRTVHRDIKPANILIGRDGAVKLVDFGLAEILATNSYAGGAGTYSYMAPEDFAEEHHSDHQSDIWAVGITLYEMLTGARPFHVNRPRDPFAWRRALLEDRPDPLAAHLESVPDGLQAVLDRALARSKADRYEAAGTFRDDLAAVRRGSVPVRVGVPAGAVREAEARAAAVPQAVAAVLPLPAQSLAAVRAGSDSVGPLPVPRQEASSAPPRRGLLRRRSAAPARAEAEPRAVHFGEIRKGDERTARVRIRIRGGEGPVAGTVVSTPSWCAVTPSVFSGRRQTLTLTADSEGVWETGEFQGAVRLETPAGLTQIAVGMRVLPPRPRFAEVAIWFVPAFLCALLPAATVAVLSRFVQAWYLVPAAALGTGLLAMMLLFVAHEADLGFGERMSAGLIMAVMAMVLGVTVGAAHRFGFHAALSPLWATGAPIGVLLVIQLFTRRAWRVWAFAAAAMGLLAAGVFVTVLSQ